SVRLLFRQLPLGVRPRADQEQILAVPGSAQHVQHRLELRAVRPERSALELERQVDARGIDREHATPPTAGSGSRGSGGDSAGGQQLAIALRRQHQASGNLPERVAVGEDALEAASLIGHRRASRRPSIGDTNGLVDSTDFSARPPPRFLFAVLPHPRGQRGYPAGRLIFYRNGARVQRYRPAQEALEQASATAASGCRSDTDRGRVAGACAAANDGARPARSRDSASVFDWRQDTWTCSRYRTPGSGKR